MNLFFVGKRSAIVLFLFRPMRMSYSAITDPCLSEEVVNSVDKVINFYKKQVPQKIFLVEAIFFSGEAGSVVFRVAGGEILFREDRSFSLVKVPTGPR